MPPAYVIVHLDVTDPEGYGKYTAQTPASVAAFGGEFLVRGGRSRDAEGTFPGSRHVVLRFPDFAAAEAWYDSPGYQELMKLRQANATGALTIVEGYEP